MAKTISSEADTFIFYDGECGLCHGFVKFVLGALKPEHRIYFSPLQGAFIKTVLDEQEIEGLPDSVVVVHLSANSKEVFLKSKGVLFVLKELGGFSSFLAKVGELFPLALADFFYDSLAKVRSNLTSSPQAYCPLVPAELSFRFKQ